MGWGGGRGGMEDGEGLEWKKGAGKIIWSSLLSPSSRDIDPVMDPLILKVQTQKQSRVVE